MRLPMMLATAVLMAIAPFRPAPAPRPTDPAVELQQQLLAALDRGDATAAGRLFTSTPLLYVLDRGDKPVKLEGKTAIEQLVTLWGRPIEDAPPAKILSSTIVADAPAAIVVAFEVERPLTDTRLYRATSVVIRGETGQQLRIAHLHLSPAGRQDY